MFAFLLGLAWFVSTSFTDSLPYAAVYAVAPALYVANLIVRGARQSSAKRWEPRGKVILVTGASSGIGEAFALRVAREGATLVLAARREKELARVEAECRRAGAADVLSASVDVTDEAAVAALVGQIETQFQRLDCVVLNAGVSMGEPLDAMPNLSVVHKVMDVNFFGCVNVAFHALSLLKRTPSSRIIITSSVLGFAPAPFRTGYCASKFALRGFFESLQNELTDHDVYVSIVYPGAVVTNINEARLGTNPMDLDMKSAISADECASIMLKAANEARKEVIIPAVMKFGRAVDGLFPELFAFITNKRARMVLTKQKQNSD